MTIIFVQEVELPRTNHFSLQERNRPGEKYNDRFVFSRQNYRDLDTQRGHFIGIFNLSLLSSREKWSDDKYDDKFVFSRQNYPDLDTYQSHFI